MDLRTVKPLLDQYVAVVYSWMCCYMYYLAPRIVLSYSVFS
jgi:hypothetical protein